MPSHQATTRWPLDYLYPATNVTPNPQSTISPKPTLNSYIIPIQTSNIYQIHNMKPIYQIQYHSVTPDINYPHYPEHVNQTMYHPHTPLIYLPYNKPIYPVGNPSASKFQVQNLSLPTQGISHPNPGQPLYYTNPENPGKSCKIGKCPGI